ncbi:hybrid sensor histidine kinase/response regulator [Ramlibacter sp. PS4R-6]|uniref:hybrid sensor histidine kinase/response regulator n=1 Tax=Ramlibacter sp. PS4R-6 TaxID=3133438 RepID=UPI0030AEF201
MIDAPPLQSLIAALAEPGTRGEAARALAHAAGAMELLLFVKDPELDVFLPAPGMPQTLPCASQWQAALRDRCSDSVHAKIEAGGQVLDATVVVVGLAAFALLGNRRCEFPSALLDSFPLLASALRAQQDLRLEIASAAEAREAATQARELARALDAARAGAAEANRQLQAEHEHKDQFLAMLAHELRNPLAPIMSALEVLRRLAPAGEARAARCMEIIGRQLQQLTHLVDDLLDVSRVSRGLIELRREPMTLHRVLAAAVDSSRPVIESRRHAFTFGSVPGGVRVDADEVRLTQVFANLLNNAAKYTPPGGAIRLEAFDRGAHVEVRVSDTGVGIPREMLTSIFDLFKQVPGSLDRAPGGLGIGLTLVRTLVELHGGTVRAESGGPGMGSTFVVVLPVARTAERETSPTSVAPAGLSPSHVLIVDDNEDAAQTLAEALRLQGMQVAVAHNGAEALDCMSSGALPDVVLLDIGLPDMDGFEVAREWRRRFGSAARLIALTGYGSPEDRLRTARAGFDAHLVKPVALEELNRLLRAAH